MAEPRTNSVHRQEQPMSGLVRAAPCPSTGTSPRTAVFRGPRRRQLGQCGRPVAVVLVDEVPRFLRRLFELRRAMESLVGRELAVFDLHDASLLSQTRPRSDRLADVLGSIASRVSVRLT